MYSKSAALRIFSRYEAITVLWSISNYFGDSCQINHHPTQLCVCVCACLWHSGSLLIFSFEHDIFREDKAMNKVILPLASWQFWCILGWVQELESTTICKPQTYTCITPNTVPFFKKLLLQICQGGKIASRWTELTTPICTSHSNSTFHVGGEKKSIFSYMH